MRSVQEILIIGKHTPVGKALDLESNIQWLAYLLYAVPFTNINLPVQDSIKAISSSFNTILITELVNKISKDEDSLKQLTEADLIESYFLAERSIDKLAIATYALYLYGR